GRERGGRRTPPWTHRGPPARRVPVPRIRESGRRGGDVAGLPDHCPTARRAVLPAADRYGTHPTPAREYARRSSQTLAVSPGAGSADRVSDDSRAPRRWHPPPPPPASPWRTGGSPPGTLPSAAAGSAHAAWRGGRVATALGWRSRSRIRPPHRLRAARAAMCRRAPAGERA